MKRKLPSLEGKSKEWIADYKRQVEIEYRKMFEPSGELAEYKPLTKAEMESDLQKLFREQQQKLGALGGRTRAKNLTAKRRKAIAKKGARARWAKKGKRQ
jgi:hypothetical protein